jgi:hypothetical protein
MHKLIKCLDLATFVLATVLALSLVASLTKTTHANTGPGGSCIDAVCTCPNPPCGAAQGSQETGKSQCETPCYCNGGCNS